MRISAWILAAMALLGAGGEVAAAHGKHAIRFGGVYAVPNGDYGMPIQFTADLGNSLSLAVDGSLTLEAQPAVGVALGYEYRATPLVGIDVNVFHAKHDVDGRIQGTYWILDMANNGQLVETGPFDASDKLDDVSVTPLTLGANFHVTPKAKVDFYVGAFAAWVTYGDLDVEGETLAFQNDFAFGVVLGLDVPVRDHGWFFGGAIRYLETKASFDEPGATGQALDFNPIVVQASAGYRF